MFKAVPKPIRKDKIKRTSKTIISKNPLEEDEQSALVQWLDLNRILYNISISGVYLHPATFNRIKKIGYRAGLPDIIIFDRPPVCHNGFVFSGAAIELKRRSGGVVSEDQKDWINKLSDRGWAASVCYGCDEAIEFLKNLGYGSK